MLLEFAIKNFKSFRDLQVFSLEASKPSDEDLALNRVSEKDGYKIVKTKAIYGANASGKSNLLNGLVTMWQLLKQNVIVKDILEMAILPYRLEKEMLKEPTYFQIIFLFKGEKYRYGFEVDHEQIHTEWLYKTKKKEVNIFVRDGLEIEFNHSQLPEGKFIKQKIKMFTNQTLVVSVLDQLNAPIASNVKHFINRQIAISASIPSPSFNIWYDRTMNHLEHDKIFVSWMNDLLKKVDNSISSLGIQSVELPNGEIQKFPIVLRDSNGVEASAPFILHKEEASGTQKLFDYASVVYHCLKKGRTLIIDEMDALLHPKLTRTIINLFHSEASHPDAQLIFVTHDTNLMDHNLLSRDQITFVEKSKEGFSEIYDLSDISGVRAHDLFEKNYLKGNYGALPILNGIEKVLLN